MKQADDQTVTGDSGVHLIVRMVDEMAHIWHPAVGPDSGIDGQIELRDPGTGEVRNVRLGVQSKATVGKWDRESDKGFTYRPKPKDIAYWLSSNQPVLLICSRDGCAYWRSVQEWARDPVARAKGYLRFDKERDRFDASTASKLFDLKAVDNDWIEPPSPPSEPERLLTNLMPIEWRTEQLWSISVPGGSFKEIFEPAWKKGLGHPAGVLRCQRYWSFAPFDDAFVQAVAGTDLRSCALDDFLSGDTHNMNVLKELIVRALVSRHDKLRWHAYKRVAYFRHDAEHEDVTYSWTSAKPRTVVHARFSREDDEHFTSYRHDAAALAVRQTGSGWAVQITPTYLFTWDGVQLSGHHDEALAGIKRLDKHRAVSSSLRKWQHLFTERATLLEPEPHEYLALKPLLEIELPLSIDAESWAELPDHEALEAQGTIFDESGYL